MAKNLVGKIILRDGRRNVPARDGDGDVILFDLDSNPRKWEGFSLLDMPVTVTAEEFEKLKKA